MQIMGFKAQYDGSFGAVPVIQAGPYKVIALNHKEPQTVPLKLAVLLTKARQAGADFLVIDPRARDNEEANWVDIKVAA